MLPGNFGRLVNGGTGQAAVRTRTAVATVYEQGWNPECPNPQVVALACGKGWAPMAWGEEMIDAPGEDPEGVGSAGTAGPTVRSPVKLNDKKISTNSRKSERLLFYW